MSSVTPSNGGCMQLLPLLGVTLLVLLKRQVH
jgi:hypothetical protein